MSTRSEQINELTTALAKAQGGMENAAKNKANPHFKSKYADLSSILDAIRGPLSSNGLSYTQTMEIGERCLIMRTTLFHTSGQFIASEYPIALALAPQQMGSAQTYARRQSLAAIVGISQDDDDGNIAMTAKPANGNGTIDTDQVISDSQRKELVELCDKTSSDKIKFCKKMEVDSLAAIRVRDFPRAVEALTHNANLKGIKL